PHGRGHLLPANLELGDVVVYGAFHRAAPRPPRTLPGRIERPSRPAVAPQWTQVGQWAGYVHALGPDSFVLHGPHPDAFTAYAASQQAQLARLLPPPPAAAASPPPTEPAQPPAAVSVAYHGTTAVVGAPAHGWLHVDAADL
nr:hypothetical protein [Micromonospora sp. DSM 115978]